MSSVQRANQVLGGVWIALWRWVSTRSAPGITRAFSEERGRACSSARSTKAKTNRMSLLCFSQEQLRHAIFPLGDSLKSDVRDEARDLGLLVADKPDSHDICFIPDGDTRAFLKRNLGEHEGDIVDSDGAVLGQHEGSFGYTVGQRKGLGLMEAAPDRAPRYVLSIEPVSNTVTVGPQDKLGVTGISGEPVNWCSAAPESPFSCRVQVRAHGETVPATALVVGDIVDLSLETPQRGVAPGQAAVMYDGERVVGSVTIGSTSKA